MDNSYKYSFENKIEALKNDFENGSTVVAQKALNIFTEAIGTLSLIPSIPVILSLSRDEHIPSDTARREMQNDKDKQIHFDIEFIKNKIIASKPAMAAVKNIIETAYRLFQMDVPPDNIKRQIIERMELASNTVIEKSLHKIIEKNYQTIATCSYSSTVMKVFKKLKNTDYQFNVLALKSKWKKRDYSKVVVEECSFNKIKAVKLNKDELLKSEFDCSLIGADDIITGKGIVNGSPSKLFSELVKEKEKPLFVVAESFKKTNQININDGFEFIDIDDIENIFSDYFF